MLRSFIPIGPKRWQPSSFSLLFQHDRYLKWNIDEMKRSFYTELKVSAAEIESNVFNVLN